MDCATSKEWNFAYILPQLLEEPIRLVVPTSLQMGWVELPPYFCAATETAWDIAMECIQTAIGLQPPHKFKHYTTGATDMDNLPTDMAQMPFYDECLRFMLMTLSAW
jgi:hypothetical protein